VGPGRPAANRPRSLPRVIIKGHCQERAAFFPLDDSTPTIGSGWLRSADNYNPHRARIVSIYPDNRTSPLSHSALPPAAKHSLLRQRMFGSRKAARAASWPWTRSSTLTSRRIKMTAGKTEGTCTEPASDSIRSVVQLLHKSDRAAVGIGESQFSRWGQAAQRPIGPISHRMLSLRGTAPARRFHPDHRERVGEECG